MSNISEILKKDDAILKVLAQKNVSRINRLICNTDQGALELEIRKGERDYHFVLGAVPLSKEESKELLDLLFPVKELEKPKQVNKEFTGTYRGVPEFKEPTEILHNLNGKTETTKIKDVPKLIKKLGRPKGSKDGVKDME